MKDVSIAVVGATGAVGTECLRIIEQRHPQLHHIKLLASQRSAGRRLRVNGRELVVEETTEESFRGVDIAFISVSTQVSRRLAPIAAAAGAVVIDDSSAFRMQEYVPLVVPEVNAATLVFKKAVTSESGRGILLSPYNNARFKKSEARILGVLLKSLTVYAPFNASGEVLVEVPKKR